MDFPKEFKKINYKVIRTNKRVSYSGRLQKYTYKTSLTFLYIVNIIRNKISGLKVIELYNTQECS